MMKAFSALFLLIWVVSAGSILLKGCRKHQTPHQVTPLAFVVPAGFPPTVYSFQDNPTSEEGFQLGKKLFYDGRLSKDGNYSCASCHQPVAAFTTFEHDRSHGYNNSHTLRNAPGLFNLAWQKEFNRDGSETSIEQVALAHITHPFEMGETMSGVIAKLQPDTAYRRLFREAYGDEKVNEGRILNALKQFVIHLVSANSKYDKVKRGEAVFFPIEETGYTIFQAKCGGCHKEPLFTDFTYRNIGLPLDAALQDHGRMRVTRNASDSLKFMVPSLRNLSLTSYYTHDGRINMFSGVIQHYRTGVVQSPTLDPHLTGGIPLTDEEASALTSFLFTLTDSSFINNPRYLQ